MVEIKLPEKSINEASKFLQRLLGPALEGLDLFSDKVRIIRFENAIKIINRAKEICKKEKIKVENIPIKFLVPFLEQASLQDDEDVTEIWARLLTSAASDYDPILMIIKDSLSRLTSKEVGLIEKICTIDDFEDGIAEHEGDYEGWLDNHFINIRLFHEKFAKNFKKFPDTSKLIALTKEYVMEFDAFMARPYKLQVPTNSIGVFYSPLLGAEGSSSFHILKETGILEPQEIRIRLPDVSNFMLRKEKDRHPDFELEEETFTAKWFQISPYGLELYLRCTKHNYPL